MARSLNYEGIEAFRNGELEKAVSVLSHSVQVDPGLDMAWFYLGEAQTAAGRPAEGKLAYEQCLKLNPVHGRALAALQSAKD
jgi:cytochrome c-type biogenesis protein CcmH/NrfG